MNKKEVLTQLRTAKSAHIEWRSYAQALIAGIPVKDDKVPVIHTECKFGQWYYGAGQAISTLSAYRAIETPHEMLHKIYMEIYKLLHAEDDRSALQKMLQSSKKLKQKNQADAEDLMKNLLSVSGTLLESINLLEREIMDMTDEELAELD